jgi:hypothetical protein
MSIRSRAPLCDERAPDAKIFDGGVGNDMRSTRLFLRCDISISHDQKSGAGQTARLHHWGGKIVWHEHRRCHWHHYCAISPVTFPCVPSPLHLCAICASCIGDRHYTGSLIPMTINSVRVLVIHGFLLKAATTHELHPNRYITGMTNDRRILPPPVHVHQPVQQPAVDGPSR